MFTLSAAQLKYNGPFFLRVFNDATFDVSYHLTVGGPGAAGMDGVDLTMNGNSSCL
jgi:hypothetical protein